MATKRFITPFAETGVKAPVSDVPAGTDVNYETGYTPEYALDPVTDPSARFVEIINENQILNDITGNIKHWQENTFPEFITAAKNGGVAWEYKKGDVVSYDGVNYESLEDANTELPTSSRWIPYLPSEIARYLEIKIFKSPTDALTEINTRTLLGGEVYEVRKVSDDSLATIYSDKNGTTEIVQNGTSNASGSDGVVDFFIADGEYYVLVNTVRSNFTVDSNKRPRYVTIADAINEDANFGTKYRITDYKNSPCEVSTGGGFLLHDFGGGKGLYVKGSDITIAQLGGGLGDDDTERAVYINSVSRKVVFDAGYTFRIQNYIPLEGTTIEAKNATIYKIDNTPHIQSSAASVVFYNNDVSVIGGTWDDLDNSESYCGSFLVYKGSNGIIKGAKIKGSWGGVTGLLSQNASDVAEDFTITECILDGCSHNTYLADIKGFSFLANHSKNSNRDGLRLWRNVENSIIIGNHIYNNGNDTLGQSRDGIDLFVAGFKNVISGNFIYGNKAKGIDIKFSPDQVGVGGGKDEKHIITNNFIYGNGDSGIEVEVSDTVTFGYLNGLNISNNEIYSNTLWGVRLTGADKSVINANQVYNNGRDGIRCENCINQLNVTSNSVYGNGQSQVSTGILIVSTCERVMVKDNDCLGSLGKQVSGIVVNCKGICKDNVSLDHESSNISTGITDGSLKGESFQDSLTSGITDISFISNASGMVSGISVSVNETSDITLQITKRDPIDGTFESTIFDDTVSCVAFVETKIPLTSSTTARAILDGQTLLVNSGSETFTNGKISLNIAN